MDYYNDIVAALKEEFSALPEIYSLAIHGSTVKPIFGNKPNDIDVAIVTKQSDKRFKIGRQTFDSVGRILLSLGERYMDSGDRFPFDAQIFDIDTLRSPFCTYSPRSLPYFRDYSRTVVGLPFAAEIYDRQRTRPEGEVWTEGTLAFALRAHRRNLISLPFDEKHRPEKISGTFRDARQGVKNFAFEMAYRQTGDLTKVDVVPGLLDEEFDLVKMMASKDKETLFAAEAFMESCLRYMTAVKT